METPSAALKIFILDDNAIDRETCRRYLSRSGGGHYTFVEHNSVDGALEIAEREAPDCILLDYHLHDGDGLEFLQQLSALGGTKKYPVVMLTGTGNEVIAVQVMKAGAQDYLVKERLNAELLERAVETAIYKARTERLLDEQRVEMERLFREAQEANSRKDQFLAALSHELRTPLTPVLAAITGTDPERIDSAQLREVFAIIRRNIELEARLIDDMLDLTRISRGKLEIAPRIIDVHQVLQHAAHACEDERRAKSIRLAWQLDAQNFQIEADPARIQQVFWNLLKNALKFTPPEGMVSISTRNRDDSLEIEVSDTGIGLRPALVDRIFDAFEQGGTEITRRFGGLGLGLAISKALIEAHHGTIVAANNSNGPGATFTVTLRSPSSAGAKVDEAQPDAPFRTTRPRGLTVLLVEDHVDSAFFIRRMLETSGYHTLIATSVAEAMDVFSREHVDGIVSDLGLPDGSGIDLMQKISGIRSVPAVALSGYGMEEDVRRSHEAGFVRHLTKPVDIQKIETVLKEILPSPPLPEN